MYKTLLLALAGLVAVCEAGKLFVIDGTDAIMHEYPSIVSLKFGRGHFCGGTLINRRTVLTAAHCVFHMRRFSEREIQRSQFVAVLGEHRLDRKSGKERIIPVRKVIIPRAYSDRFSFVYGNDIALVHLSRDVNDEDHVKFAKIPTQGGEPSYPGDNCTVVGWGSLHKHGRGVTNILQKANLTILSNNDCALKFTNVRNNPSNVCAGSGYASRSACKGDSGGPLFCGQGSSMVQVGVVSYGRVPCGQPYVPTVFTRVSNFESWILNNISTDSVNDLD